MLVRFCSFNYAACFVLGIFFIAFSGQAVAEPNQSITLVDCKYAKEVKRLCSKGQFPKARELLQKALDEFDPDSKLSKSDLLMDIAGCYFNIGKYDLAQKTVEKSLKLKATAEDRYCPARKIFNLAECFYFQRKFDTAILKYLEAVKIMEKYNEPKLKRRLYMSLASCYSVLDNFEEAKKYQEEAVRLDKAIFGPRNINYGWGLYKLGDIYKQLKDPRTEIVISKAIWIFRLKNRERLLEENSLVGELTSPEEKELAGKIDSYLFGITKDYDFEKSDSFLFAGKDKLNIDKSKLPKNCSVWKNQYEVKQAPGIAWLNPYKPLKAIVLTVHGLGLHHGVYESFGRRIAREGVMTISFDVRGFGTYLESKGSELVDMDRCVEDLRDIFSMLHRDYPTTPIFLLGESMGGAIVMRVGALYPEGISGIICSVPSGSRYEPAITKVKIGLNYLREKNNQVDIAPYVVGKATSNLKLQERWKLDSSSRLRLSPKELLNFRRFMNENTTYAKKITNLPVLIFQGDEDGLVKSKGTYDLFEAVKSKDKTLVVVGGTEHLIFEAGQFKNGIALGVVGWLTAHCERAPVKEKSAMK